jgi:hypothetical protein
MLMISNGVVVGNTYANSAFRSVFSTQVVPTNAWTHAVFEQDYLGNLILYVNGSLVGTVPGGPTYLNNVPYFFVGGHGDQQRDFAGTIADVRLFNNYALSAQDVFNLYVAGVSAFPIPLPPGFLQAKGLP